MNPLVAPEAGTARHVDGTALSVNVNKVALLRNTRHLGIPSVVRASLLCLQAGAHGITVHPRPDERHIRAGDVADVATLLKDWPQAEYNIEGNPFHNLMAFIRDVRPHQATFVPDSEGQFTSDHGWDVAAEGARLRPLIEECHDLGVRVSLFMDATPQAMAGARALGADRVELYTEPYAAAHAAVHPAAHSAAGVVEPSGIAPHDAESLSVSLSVTLSESLSRFAAAARAAQAVGLGVNAGHDLNQQNLAEFLQAVPGVLEVSIGHALMAEALEVGLPETVRSYLRCIRLAR